ncbi:hypothetical protein LZF95_13010 [Algoriphagus sp. AGSA1]|uniref:hypothetical protein n=1 Tax=Algoriphagus sp. AGSA1 TaxID=2907213 RepID=UPI001F2476A2|nr:hypothetical protein [Algoriphagus sp. AGSA1]MCE7055601.1 hypothetical protein [Algoriphagus sp. AGSA1]
MTRIFLHSLIVFFVFIILAPSSPAQTFIGNTLDSYSGVHALLLNPALSTDSKMRMDINILSSSAFIGNDYLSVDLSDLNNFRNGFEINSDGAKNSKNNNNFFGNIDILGPSILFNINDKNSLAFTSRARGFFGLNNVGGNLYELANTKYEEQSDFNLTMEDASGSIHAWAEIGVTYANMLIDTDYHSLKGGITLKYLAGAGGVFGNSQLLSVNYNYTSNILTTSGTMRYGYTSGFDSGNINFSSIKSGIGADLGLVYEYKEQNVNTYYNPYKFRLGISLMDIGAINYGRTPGNVYAMDGNFDADEFSIKDLEVILNDYYKGVETGGNTKMGLPTSFQFFGDYNIDGKFFLSAQGALSIKNNKENPVSNLINSFTVTPRLEKRWVSVYSPLSIRQYDSALAWGLGVRAGPVMIGSGSILTNLISNTSRSTDIYVGFKVPLYN